MTSTIDIVGNVTEDVTLRTTQSGKQVANVSVAVNHRKKDAQGNWVDDGTDFYRVELWGAEANNASQSIRKGDRVIVAGGQPPHPALGVQRQVGNDERHPVR